MDDGDEGDAAGPKIAKAGSMLTLSELRCFARAAAQALARERDLADFEVYCSSSEELVARLNYTSDIPSRGVEEVKSNSADGFALRVAFRRDPHRHAAASEAGELSLASLRRALERARRTSVVDPDFPGLPGGPRRLYHSLPAPLEPADLTRAGDRQIVEAAWRAVGGAMEAFARRAPSGLARPGLIVGGDLTLVRDRIALAGSRFDDVRVDRGAHFRASVSAIVEALEAKGTAGAVGRRLADLERVGPLGAEAVARALRLKHGCRPQGGVYRTLLGPQPVAEILNYMVIPSLTAGAFYAASSAYHGRFGAMVMDPRLSLVDDPRASSGAIQRRMTCEGMAARRVELIRDGRLVGLLANFYDAHRLAADAARGEKLGAAADGAVEVAPASGYRLGDGAARRFDALPAAAASNVLMRARGGVGERALLRALGEGVYVGRLWYTYPINGQRAGDFTCTVSGDSYLVKGGELVAPLAPNCLRLNARLEQVFGAVVAAGRRSHPALVWGSPEAYYVPALVVDGLALSPVGVGG